MKIGLIGLPMTGKTTFYQLLTESRPGATHRGEASIGTAKIPDARIDFLSGVYKPKKTTYATLEVTDIQGIAPSASTGKGSGSYHFLEAVRQVDALVHVVRAFENSEVIHTEGAIDPIRDIETVHLELLFADLAVIENRIQRIQTGKKITKENEQELIVLNKCRECLESEKLINTLQLSEEEKPFLKTYNFLTERPMVLLINLDDAQFMDGDYPQKEAVARYAARRQIPLIEVCAKTELEISELDPADRALFMEDLGLTESGIHKLASAVYELLGLISFLTVGEDEVRAWTLRRGTTAKNAGGKIHTDIARGFIRAEVAKYEDFHVHGTMTKLKEKGLVRLEGKEAIIEDGDIINFRFNV